MNAHTPGPWIVANGKHIIDCKGLELATLPNDDDWEDEHAANARLIAAAPELLDALKKALKIVCEQEDALRQLGANEPNAEPAILTARDAIAKAEGKQ